EQCVMISDVSDRNTRCPTQSLSPFGTPEEKQRSMPSSPLSLSHSLSLSISTLSLSLSLSLSSALPPSPPLTPLSTFPLLHARPRPQTTLPLTGCSSVTLLMY